jgi:hypothetical protein
MKKALTLGIVLMLGILFSGITIGSGARVNFGNATIGVYGNLKNSSSNLTTVSTSRLAFVGSANDTITNLYSFPNLTVSKPGGTLRLNNSTNNFQLTGNIAFTQGNVVTGTNTLELGSTATVTGESATGYVVGTVKAARAVGTGTSAGTGNFGGIGYSINNTGSDLGTVTVYRYSGSGNQVTIYGSPGILRKWTVETSNAFSGSRQVTASWLSNEDNGNVLANLKAWKYVAAKDGIDENDNLESEKVRRFIEKKDKLLAKSNDRETADNFTRGLELEEDEYGIIADEPKTLGWVEVDGAVFSTASSPRTATFTMDAATTFTINDTSNIFADGAGTASNPYQIATLDQLNAVRNYLSAHFIQIADIDASATTGWNSGAGWLPIPNFAGKYNGDGHTVSNLFMNRPSGTTYVGLFGITNTGSEIKDIGLIGLDVTGGNYTGGFVGYSRGTVKNCYAKGSVKSSTGSWTGGFAGYTASGSDINNCYANVEVTRLSGGTETVNIGAFCGRLYSSPITNCYSTGGVHYEGTTDPTNKGFFGAIGSGAVMSGNFWNTETSAQATTGGTATGLTKDQMRTLLIFTNATWDFQGESANGTEDTWGINAVLNSGYPFLSWEGITHSPSPFAGGIGTSDEPFLVSNLTQLDAVRNFKSYYFLQTADIDASATTGWDSNAGWIPVSTASPYFTGNYNGGFHKITGLFINRSANLQSLFGYSSGAVISNLSLADANITGAQYVAGISSYTVSTTVSNCSFSGSIVTGASGYAGGITAYAITGTLISECSSYGSVRAATYGGGISGRVGTNSQIRNCYASGSVSRISGYTSTVFGGICGYNNDAKILKSYSVAPVIYENATNPTNRGIVGAVTGTTTYEMADNFFDSQVTGQTTTAGIGTAKTTAEMRNVATYTSLSTAGLTNPWDFVGNPYDDMADTNMWSIHTSINSGYPYLSYEYRLPVEAPTNLALLISGTDVIITWDPVTDATSYAVYSGTDPYGVMTLDETGSFNGTEWTGAFTGSKMFYYVTALNSTKILPQKTIINNNMFMSK